MLLVSKKKRMAMSIIKFKIALLFVVIFNLHIVPPLVFNSILLVRLLTDLMSHLIWSALFSFFFFFAFTSPFIFRLIGSHRRGNITSGQKSAFRKSIK